MRTFPKRLLLPIAAIAILLGAAEAKAQKSVAIVVDIDGKATPAVAANAELADKSVVALDAGAVLTIVHYKSCMLVTVKGGKFAVEEAKYDASGTSVVSEEKVSCPAQQTALAESNQSSGTAALVLRGAGEQRTFIPLRPWIMAVGAQSSGFTKAEILDGTTIVATVPLANGRAKWPTNAKPLVGYRQYTIRFVPASGKPITFPVTATPQLSPDGKAPTVFRIG
jgi:hypothetical protein